MNILFLFFAIGPAILGYSSAYILKTPDKWQEALSIIIISLFITIITNTIGVKLLKKNFSRQVGKILQLSQLGGIALGIILFFVMYFYLI
jgi:hypothetical protein